MWAVCPIDEEKTARNGFVIDCIEREFLKFRLTGQRRRHGRAIRELIEQKPDRMECAVKGERVLALEERNNKKCSRSIRDANGYRY